MFARKLIYFNISLLDNFILSVVKFFLNPEILLHLFYYFCLIHIDCSRWHRWRNGYDQFTDSKQSGGAQQFEFKSEQVKRVESRQNWLADDY